MNLTGEPIDHQPFARHNRPKAEGQRFGGAWIGTNPGEGSGATASDESRLSVRRRQAEMIEKLPVKTARDLRSLAWHRRVIAEITGEVGPEGPEADES